MVDVKPGAGTRAAFPERRLETWVATFLRLATYLSASLLALSLLAGWAAGLAPRPHSVWLLQRAPEIGRSGLLLLLMTPVVRVALSGVIYALNREWLNVAISGGVLAILFTGFCLGAAHH